MIDTKRSLKTLAVTGIVTSLLVLSAHAQTALGNKIPQSSTPPVENRPKVDEKAYKAALDRIPTPKQAYDPWGNARPSEPVKPGKTSN